MMGEQQRTESLFYYFRLEDQIPNDHLLRLIDRHIDFGFVRERLRMFCSSTGRPSIDPEVLLRLLLVGFSLSGCFSTAPYVRPQLRTRPYSLWLPETSG
jgi:transposase